MKLLDNLVYSSEDICTFAKRNAPELLNVGSAILATAACAGTGIATWKVKDKIEEHNANIYDLHEDMKCAKDEEERQRIQKDIWKEYGNTALTAAKYYSVPGALLAGSIACDIASIKNIRNIKYKLAMTSGALLLLKNRWDEAQKKSVEKYGEEATADIFYDSDTKEITTVNEKGKEKTEKIKVYDPYGVALSNPCAMLIGEGIESNFTGRAFDNLNLYKSVLRRIELEVNATGSCCLWDVYTDKGWGFGLVPSSKDQEYLWKHSGWYKDQSKIDEAISKLYETVEKPTAAQIDNAIDKAQGITLGLDHPLNKRFKLELEPTLWLLPNCVLNYEDYKEYSGTNQLARYNEAMAI